MRIEAEHCHQHHHHSSENGWTKCHALRIPMLRFENESEREKDREAIGETKKQMALNLHISTNCKSIAAVPLSVSCCSTCLLEARGDRPYIHIHPVQNRRIHTCPTRYCCCRALYSNDSNNHKNANIICHFLFQHATYHTPSAVKCYILKYKFNSYFLSLSSRIIVMEFCLLLWISNARPILLTIITIKRPT